MTRETARFKDLLVKFLASLDFQNQEDRGRRNQLLLKQKQLNECGMYVDIEGHGSKESLFKVLPKFKVRVSDNATTK